mmetsp:Transcript_48467/g.125772  ORF Transcript_48467/g.125772 Transcript_48467/m.125772 type:complete len:218 (+) Transcript_48467:934-1587(+)
MGRHAADDPHGHLPEVASDVLQLGEGLPLAGVAPAAHQEREGVALGGSRAHAEHLLRLHGVRGGYFHELGERVGHAPELQRLHCSPAARGQRGPAEQQRPRALRGAVQPAPQLGAGDVPHGRVGVRHEACQRPRARVPVPVPGEELGLLPVREAVHHGQHQSALGQERLRRAGVDAAPPGNALVGEGHVLPNRVEVLAKVVARTVDLDDPDLARAQH